MIQSFRHKGIQRLFVGGERRGVRPDLIDMKLPGFRLHPLKGSLKGFWSVTVRANWRIIFRFQDGHVWDVDLIYYH